MSHVEHSKSRPGERLLAAVGLLAAVLVSCTRAETVEVTAAAPPRPPATTTDSPTSRFQGSVASVDLAGDQFVLDVQIVWTPVLAAERSARRVALGPATRWEPAGNGLAGLHVGDEVQVEAERGPDGTWWASKVQLFDID